MRHFFAPIPAVHLKAVADTFAGMGAVALGSNQFELLSGLKGPATFWLCASTGYVPEGGVPGIDIGKVLYRSQFVSAEMANCRGMPARPELRPQTTSDDGAWTMFYVVNDLCPVDPPIPAAELRKVRGGRFEVAEHMLVEIKRPAG